MSQRLRDLRRAVLGLVLLVIPAACAAPPPAPGDPFAGRAPSDRSVYVVRRGWHADIAVSRSALLALGQLPEAADFPGAALLEFGWGDRDYFMAAEPTAWMAVRAALVPTPAVLLVRPLAHPPSGPALEVARLELSDESLARLALAIADSFDRGSGTTALPLAEGRPPGARFYPARGRFTLANTCNTWVAGVLAAAGLDIAPREVVTAGALMRRVEAALRDAPPTP